MKSLCFCLPIRPVGVWGPYKIDVLLSSLNRLLLLPARTRRLIIIPCPQLLHSTPLLFARRITHLGLGRSPVCGIAPTAERRIGSPGNAARISNRLREGKSEGLRVGRRWGWNEQGGRCKEIGDMFLVVQNLDPGDEQKCCATKGEQTLTPSQAPAATRILSSPPSLYLAASSAISCRSSNRFSGVTLGSWIQSISV